MKAAHTVLYMKKHTQTYASYPAMDISCMSVRYIEMHRGPAAYVQTVLGLGPPPSRGRDLELEGESMHATSSMYSVPRLPRARYRVMAS